MRALLPLLATACATAPCGVELCAHVCEKLGVHPGEATEFGFQQVLTAGELAVLGSELEELRAGVVVITDRTFVCGGAERCTRPIPDAAGPLPDGAYTIEVAYDTPRRSRPGEWSAFAAESCTVQRVTKDGTDELVERRSERPKLESAPGDEGNLRILAFESPAPDGARACNWRVTFQGPEGRTSVEGRYDVPATSEAVDPSPEDAAPETPAPPPGQAPEPTPAP